jgi:hypothetical protein
VTFSTLFFYLIMQDEQRENNYLLKLVGTDSTYLKQYKLKFNPSFQHLKYVVSIVQNNFSRLFLHNFLITTIIHFP